MTEGVDPELSARTAGLRYVSDEGPGVGRERVGADFKYLSASGEAIDDEATLARIRSLAIPPAWEKVWICPLANGHIQATGRDAKGRKQYRYHPRLCRAGETQSSCRDRKGGGQARQYADYLPQMLRTEILNSYMDGNLVLGLKSKAESELRADVQSLKPEEAAVLALLRGRLAKEAERQASKKQRVEAA